MTPLLLIICVLVGGIIPFLWKPSEANFKHALVFSAAYLLCVTLVHLFPELFEEAKEHQISSLLIGVFLLLGFLFQKILEYFSGGIEHGHIHTSTAFRPYTLLIALCLHALLEGSVIAGTTSHHHHSDHLLFGIILHKMPAAFALTSILLDAKTNIKKTIVFLVIFSLASPLGLLLSELLLSKMPERYTIYLMALVTGNLLHIATIIFFESSHKQRFNVKRWVVILLGILLALGVEFV